MLLSSKFLRMFISLCVLIIAAQSSQTAFSQEAEKDQRKGYESYVKGLFKVYDADRNGLLDAKEIKKMRRKPDGKADANSDGGISPEELLDLYLTKVKLKAGRRKDSDSRFRKKETKENETEELSNTVTMICDGSKITLLGDAVDVASVEAMLQKAMKKAGDAKPSMASENTVALSVWIVDASDSIDMDRLKGKSREFVAAAMAKLADADNSTVQIEEFHLDTSLGQPIELTRSGQVPVIQGATQSRGGNWSNQISNYEVGTTLKAKATRSGENVLIEFDIEKSTVEDSDVALSQRDDETIFAKAVRQYKLEAEVVCESGKACVVQSRKNDRSWTLVFCADPAPISSMDDSAGSRKSDSRERDTDSRNRQRRSRN